MKQERHSLVTTVFVMGAMIALLSYLFHPDVGVFKLIVNGQPVDNAFVQFAAIPSVLAVMLLCGILAVLLYFGVGLVMFFIALFVAMLGVFLIAPFFWPVLVIIFLGSPAIVMIFEKSSWLFCRYDCPSFTHKGR